MFNNLPKLNNTSLIGHLLNPLSNKQKKDMSSLDNYLASRARIDADNPFFSRDTITAKLYP